VSGIILCYCSRGVTPLVSRVAARYKKKLLSDEGNTIYQYSERQIALRNSKKAERLEKLRKSVHKLRARVKKDLTSKDPETALTALVVGLMDHTAERVGNETSKEERGHVGVTGWQKSHVSFGKAKATVSYTGKSGVKQKKTVSERALITALKKAHESCKEGDLFCHEGGKVTAEKVNSYLEEFDITAKDLRGLHANVGLREALERVRAAGGKLPSDSKERKARLKKEFTKALQETADAIGHEASTLRSQYLTPGVEEQFLKDGEIMKGMVASLADRYLQGAP
jgi:DNA topoisomerase-1